MVTTEKDAIVSGVRERKGRIALDHGGCLLLAGKELSITFRARKVS